MSKPTKQELQQRVDTISSLVQELHDRVRTKYPGGFVYFEAEGSLHVMRRFRGHLGGSERQDDIAVSSPTCSFDCGAW